VKCREFVEFLMEYLDGALVEGERHVFEQHIEDCPACVNYLDTYRETVRLGNSLCSPDAEVPADVPEELVQAILSARRDRTGPM
jgi:anti-sigma factor RsiW